TNLATDASRAFNLKCREPTLERWHFATSDSGIVMAAGGRIFVIVNTSWNVLMSQLGPARGTTQPTRTRLWERDFRMARKRATHVDFRSGGESHLRCRKLLVQSRDDNAFVRGLFFSWRGVKNARDQE